MNILLINHYAGSPEWGMEFRPYYMAKEWIKMGHVVHVFAAEYSHLRIKNPCVPYNMYKQDVDGVYYHWIKTTHYQGNGVKRALSMLQFVYSMWREAQIIVEEIVPDVVITSSTYPLDIYAGIKIKKKSAKHVKLIHEIHDMWPLTLIELGGMSKWNPFVVAMQVGENCFCKRADKVVSLLPRTSTYLRGHGMSPDKFVHIPNGIFKAEWDVLEPLPNNVQDVLDEIREEREVLIGYLGGHAMSNALDTLLETAELMKDTNVGFVLIGEGVEKSRLQQEAMNASLSHVYFLPAVPKKYIPTITSGLDILYLGAKKSDLYRFGISMNKLYDYMMAGKPIIYAVEDPDNYIDKFRCGMTIEPENSLQLKEAIRSLLKLSCEERRCMGENGKRAVLDNFTYEKLAKNFSALF